MASLPIALRSGCIVDADLVNGSPKLKRCQRPFHARSPLSSALTSPSAIASRRVAGVARDRGGAHLASRRSRPEMRGWSAWNSEAAVTSGRGGGTDLSSASRSSRGAGLACGTSPDLLAIRTCGYNNSEATGGVGSRPVLISTF